MTAQGFAELLNGRRVGRGRWVAKCPSHRDRSPSLSLREGQDGRILVHCFAGCTHTAILAALGLVSRDLYAWPPPSPQEARNAALVRVQRAAEKQAQRHTRRAATARVRKLEAACNALGAKLARIHDDSPECDELTRLFHEACNRLHAAEVALESVR